MSSPEAQDVQDVQDQVRAGGPAREMRDDGGVSRGARWGRPLLVPVMGLVLSMLFAMLVLQMLVIRQLPAEPPVVQAREPDSTAAALQAMVGGIAQLADRLEALEGQLSDLRAKQAETLEQASAASRRVAQVAALVQGGRDEAVPPQSTAAQSPTPDAPARETAPGRDTTPEVALHHHLRPSDTLWSIAKRYYGHGWLYPVLIAQNPGLGVYHDGTGTLGLFADSAQALNLYRRITPQGAEGRFFRYQVQPGDDWRGLASRFLGRPDRAPELMAPNPGSDLAPGSRILIPLE